MLPGPVACLHLLSCKLLSLSLEMSHILILPFDLVIYELLTCFTHKSRANQNVKMTQITSKFP